MIEYVDCLDDEGYRACLTSDQEETLIEFGNWLDQQGIAWTHDATAASEVEEFTIWTEWIADKGKAALLKLTFGGAL
ncbi:hypothetical protein [Erythrobacter sp. R86502]|uniref:hypothetical protein n=1 Tax=Erythrobacter sp. R86502 TaxID=3093846 RepID=UPI0036D2C7FC